MPNNGKNRFFFLGRYESESELEVWLLPEDVEDEAQYSDTRVEEEQVNDDGMGIFDESPPGVLFAGVSGAVTNAVVAGSSIATTTVVAPNSNNTTSSLASSTGHCTQAPSNSAQVGRKPTYNNEK